ncbi:hypothetical protein JT201_00680 [Helicobacter pylori]|nr:hypothetical protein [Helicobacter pylori]WQR85533.1 hypothetical protein KVE91_04750 [Helicobacter pylori]
MKKLNITSDKVSQSLINAMKTYKIKPTLKTTLSEAVNNPNLKAFDELTKKRKIQHNRSFPRLYKHLYKCGCLSANREFKLSLWQDEGFDTAADMIVDYYKWVCWYYPF